MPFDPMLLPQALDPATAALTRSSIASRRVAAAVSFAMVLACLIIAPYANTALPAMPAFQALFAGVVMVSETATAYMLAMQFIATRRMMVAALAIAYAFTALIAVIQVTLFPGVLAPHGLFDAGSQSAVWLWVIWHAAFPIMAIVSVAANYRWPRALSRSTVLRIRPWLIVLPFAAAATVFLWVTHWHESLPVVIRGGDFNTLARGLSGKAVLVLCALSIVLVAAIGRARSNLLTWLIVACLSNAMDSALCLFGGERFTMGWYVSRLLSVSTSTVVLGVAIWSITKLYLELAVSNQHLTDLASQDGLTGLYNRRHFDAFLEELVQRPESVGQLCLVMVDVDHFKEFNDRFGHPAGDAVLRTVAQALKAVLRSENDLVARFGGEEFAIVLPAAGHVAALSIAERIRSRIGNVQGDGTDHKVTVSIGLAVMNEPMQASALLEHADSALYRAKSQGRNRVESYVVRREMVA